MSHGRNAAFSTGSHAHGPPQPSSSYAQSIPSVLPIDRNRNEKSIHLRVATIHSLSSLPVARAATAKANGTAALVKPM